MLEPMGTLSFDRAYEIIKRLALQGDKSGADFIIIDRDIFNINPIDIENTKVLQTFFNGKLVYDIKQK